MKLTAKLFYAHDFKWKTVKINYRLFNYVKPESYDEESQKNGDENSTFGDRYFVHNSPSISKESKSYTRHSLEQRMPRVAIGFPTLALSLCHSARGQNGDRFVDFSLQFNY
jgi:hypothetical protein